MDDDPAVPPELIEYMQQRDDERHSGNLLDNIQEVDRDGTL